VTGAVLDHRSFVKKFKKRPPSASKGSERNLQKLRSCNLVLCRQRALGKKKHLKKEVLVEPNGERCRKENPWEKEVGSTPLLREGNSFEDGKPRHGSE